MRKHSGRLDGMLVAVALAGLTGCGASRGAAPKATGPHSAATAPAAMTPAQIAAKATPAVVSIRSANSLGTGFVVRKDGWIATNLHVVTGARELVVVLSNGNTFPVTDIVALDKEHDLAVLRIHAENLPTLALGDSDAVHSGDPIVAIGHPLGLEDTVSNGLVSAVRDVSDSLTILQISAPIAPGSSGGPLIDERGHVIGVATAFIKQGQNLNFGVPVGYLKTMLAAPEPVPFETFVASTPAPVAPKRAIPHHDTNLLFGCSEGDLRLLGGSIDAAIQVGAPIFDEGNPAATYHLFEGASIDAERKISASCRGPRKALGDARRKAATLGDPAAQAWAMRDGFDGLLEVIVKKLAAGH